MAKNEQLQRLFKVVRLLRTEKSGLEFKDIRRHLEKEFNHDSLELSFSEKTFQRDRKLLDELFNIRIIFNKSTSKYQLTETESGDYSDYIFENLMISQALRHVKDNQDLVLFEKRTAKGIEHFDDLLKSIKNQKIISFNYKKHWSDTVYKKVVEPCGLKEFRNRWYLIGKEFKQNADTQKIYGLDRISNLETSATTFKKENVDLEKLFIHSFGITATENEKPETILLSFQTEQAAFVKSLPLHHSQKIVTDSDKEFTISLHLVPTYDFYQELLTHAERLTVISPQTVKNEYLRFLNTGIDLNKK